MLTSFTKTAKPSRFRVLKTLESRRMYILLSFWVFCFPSKLDIFAFCHVSANRGADGRLDIVQRISVRTGPNRFSPQEIFAKPINRSGQRRRPSGHPRVRSRPFEFDRSPSRFAPCTLQAPRTVTIYCMNHAPVYLGGCNRISTHSAGAGSVPNSKNSPPAKLKRTAASLCGLTNAICGRGGGARWERWQN